MARLASLSFGLLLLLQGGCYLRPEFREAPGTLLYQRSRAVVHDPFPDNTIGPPVVGGRASGFEVPLSEPARLQSTTPVPRPGF